MNPITHHIAKRRGVALGLFAGSWLVLSACALGAEIGHAVGTPPAAETAPPAAQADAAAPAGKPVSFADDQAERGKKKFESACVDCHGEELRGGLNGGPPLRGNAFDELFANGAPASALFVFMSTQMPPDSPGRFSPSQYADMMAFILKTSGYQAGAPLPSDTDALDALIMTK